MTAEAVALARMLMDRAKQYQAEAHHWQDTKRMVSRLQWAAHVLEETARTVLRDDNLVLGEGWLTSADMTLEHIKLCRAFMASGH